LDTRILRVAAAIFVLVCSLHLFLYAQLPEARRNSGWPTEVMHNWHEFGYWHLGGQLVANPGGLDAGEEPFIYPGHRPFFLVLPYLLKELPGAAGGDGLLYDFAVLALIYSAVLGLLGAGLRGILIASAVCLAPGVMNNIADVDTLGVTFLFGLAAMSFAGGALARHEAKLSTRLGAFAVMVVYMLLNWPTLFPLGITAVYVLCKRSDWKKVAGLFAVALAVGLGVLVVSMHSRHVSGTNSGDFWNSYLWGPLGYDGSGMDTGKAFVRITAVNSVAWLGLAVAGFAVLLCNGLGENWRRAPWPLLASIAAVFVLRNYNAHHPWNAVCQIGLGMVFSLELLVGEKPIATRARLWTATGVAVAFSVFYVVAWLAFYEFNKRDFDPLHEMITTQTPRHALIVVADGLTSAGQTDLKPYEDEFDRKLMPLDEWNLHAAEIGRSGKDVYLLAHVTVPPGATLVAESQIRPTWADRIMAPLFEFYRTKISRRASGDRKQYFDEYRLYKL
jgi:hypothetical protein